MMQSFYFQTALVTSITNFSLAVIVLLRGSNRYLHRSFAALSFVFGLWTLGNFFANSRLISIALAFMPVSLLHFTLCLARRPKSSRFWLQVTLGYPISALFAVAVIGQMIQGHYLLLVLLLYTLGFVIGALTVLIERLSELRPRLERHQIVYVLVGSTVALVGGSTDLLARVGVPVPRLGNLSILLYVIIIAVAIVRHRLLDLGVLVGRVIVLFVVAFLMWSLFGLMGAWWAGTAYHSFFPVVVATVLLLIFYEPLKLLIERRADLVLQRQSYEFQRELTSLSHDLARLIPLPELVARVAAALYRSSKIERFAIYLAARPKEDFQLMKARGLEGPRLHVISRGRQFIKFLSQRRSDVDIDEIERDLSLWHPPERQKELMAVARTLSWLKAELVVPFIFESELIGFLSLATREPDVSFSEREREILVTIGNQLALSMVNLQSHDQMAQTERLAALGEMAAGLAHEIKNPLGAIKASAQMLEQSRCVDSPEFLEIIIDEVNRLDRVVTRFLDFARPIEGSFSDFDAGLLLHKTVDFLRPDFSRQNVDIELLSDKRGCFIKGNPDLLKQVFLNVLVNAAQAMPTGGKIVIFISDVAGDEGQPAVRFSIRDSGTGIAVEHIRHIFDPFFTSKPGGTGLGLAIAKKIVTAHHGTIGVSSMPGKGAEFWLLFPKSQREDSNGNVCAHR